MRKLLLKVRDVQGIKLYLGAGEIVGMVIINEFGLDKFLKAILDDKPPTTIWRSSSIAIVDGLPRLVASMSIAENLFVLRKNAKMNLINFSLIHQETTRLLQQADISAKSTLSAGKLDTLQRLQVELLRAKLSGNKVVILKEIGTLLDGDEKTKLLYFIKDMAKSGMAFIYMDAYPESLFDACSRYLIYNSGHVPKVFYKGELTPKSMEPYSDNRMLPMDICQIYWDEKKQQLPQLLKAFLEQGAYLIPEDPIQNSLYLSQSYLFNLTFGLDKKIGKSIIPKRMLKSIQAEFAFAIGKKSKLDSIENLSKKELLSLVYYRALVLRPKEVVIYQPFIKMDMQLHSHMLELIHLLKERNIDVIILTSHLGNVERGLGQVIEIS